MKENYCLWYDKPVKDVYEYEDEQCKKNSMYCDKCNMCTYIENYDECTETYVDYEENPEYYTVRKERGNEK